MCRLNWRKGLVNTVREARSLGVNQVVIFPKVSAWRRRARTSACVSRSHLCSCAIHPVCRSQSSLVLQLLSFRCLPSQTPDHLKTPTGEEAFNPDGLAQRSIALLKDTFPDVEVRTLTPV